MRLTLLACLLPMLPVVAGCKDQDPVAKEMQRVHDQMRKDSLKIKGRKPPVYREPKLKPWDPKKVKISTYPKKPYAKSKVSKLRWKALKKDAKQIEAWYRDYIKSGTLQRICDRTKKRCQEGGRCYKASRILCDNQHRWRGRAWWTRNVDEQVSMILAEKWTREGIRKWLQDYKDVVDALRRQGYSQVVFSTMRDVRHTHRLGWHKKPWVGLAVALP